MEDETAELDLGSCLWAMKLGESRKTLDSRKGIKGIEEKICSVFIRNLSQGFIREGGGSPHPNFCVNYQRLLKFRI